jgi:DNA-binding response OmpR family regulator
VVLGAREILRNVWGDHSREKLSVLRTTISRLRKKLGDDVKNPVFISGRYGMGYTMKVQ